MSKIIGELNAAGICGSMNTANMTGTIGNGIVKYDSSTELYTGEYNVVPKAAEEQKLPCAGKKMLKDVDIKAIPFFETANATGTTVYIAAEVD